MRMSMPLRFVCAAVAAALTGCSNGSTLPQGAVAPQGAAAATSSLFARKTSSASEYLYVENGDSTIAAYSVAADGALTEIDGSPYPSNTNSPATFAIAVDPKGPYLFTTGTVSNNVAVFSIGSGGVLSALSSSTSGGSGAGFPLLTKSDGRLYVANYINGGALAAFDVAKNGGLKAIAGSPYQVTCPGFCDPNPDYAVINGSYMYVVDTYGWYVSTFSIAKNGALTELNSYATHYGPTAAVMTPDGSTLYVTNGASADISAYSVAGGVLTQLNGSPFGAGGNPSGIAMTSNGKYVYVANYGDGTISGYSIGNGGALDQLSGSPFPDGNGTGPTALGIDKGNKHLFVTNQSSDNIAVYSIAKSGALSQISGSPFSNPNALGPRGLAVY